MEKYFGTDGFRGRANVELTVEHALSVGRFLGDLCRDGVLIGRDTRRSSQMLVGAVAAGAAASGADVTLAGVVPTPAISHLVARGVYGGGVMISASHNAYEDNGIKLFGKNGEKLGEEQLERLEHCLDDARLLPPTAGVRAGRIRENAAERDAYRAYLLSLANGDYKGLRIGLDAANGSAYSLARELFAALGATVLVIGDQPNGENINLRCGSTHIEALQRLVVQNGLDVGFAFDGDADRCIAVDHSGEVVDGDTILYIMACAMQAQGRLHGQTVVTTVMSNMGLYRALEQQGIRYEKTAVGDKYVAERMQKNGYALGGEQSGHVIFGAYSNTGDGLLTALQLTNCILESKLPLYRLKEGYRPYPQRLRSFPLRSKSVLMADADLWLWLCEVERELGENGRVVVRPSGTEPLVRVMVEAVDPMRCDAFFDRVVEGLGARGHFL